MSIKAETISNTKMSSTLVNILVSFTIRMLQQQLWMFHLTFKLFLKLNIFTYTF